MRARVVVRLAGSALVVGAVFLAGCTVGPKYARPSVAAPPAYKELTPENFKDTDGWKQAQPGDATLQGKWWELFDDPELNSLEEQVNVSNQNIAAAAASFLEARALVRQARAAVLSNAYRQSGHHQFAALSGTIRRRSAVDRLHRPPRLLR